MNGRLRGGGARKGRNGERVKGRESGEWWGRRRKGERKFKAVSVGQRNGGEVSID